MPEPNLFVGPLLPDVEKAASAGIALGGLTGFVAASVRYSSSEIGEIIKWASYSGLLAAVFGAALVLFGRVT